MRRLTTITLLLLGSPTVAQSVDATKSSAALAELRKTVEDPAKPPRSLSELQGRPFATVPLTKADAAAARESLWKLHASLVRAERTKEIADRVLVDGELKMPFAIRSFDDKPKTGRSLWLSLHGGGNAPKQVNDQQWGNQQKIYSLAEGLYVCPRAPTNTWNLWHEPHIDRMFARLIEDLIVLQDVNPDRVYVMGYSAGGDGVYQLAPRMADRWAGAAMMAGHPNGVSLLSLRNVPFALQVGGKDAAFNRNRVAREYGELLDKLQKDDPKGYPHYVKIHEDKAHWMNLEDKVALPWLAKFDRNPTPDRIVWKQTGTVHDRSYWLAVPPKEGRGDSLVVAQCDGQKVEIVAADKIDKLLVRLDDRMLNLDEDVVVTFGGKELYRGTTPRTIGTMLKTLAGRGDPRLTFDAEVAVSLPAEKKGDLP